MNVEPVGLLQDNYAYLLTNGSSRCVVVDPSEALPVAEAMRRRGLKLEAIWLTHHHYDHVGGVEGLLDRAPSAADIEVIGSDYDLAQGRIPRQTRGLRPEETFEWGSQQVRTLHVPGHTLGAVAYLVEGHLFTGDTLFLAGCGRLFEGDAAQMSASLKKLRRLPAHTKIWCGHEYTEANLRFALDQEPSNEQVRERLERIRKQRAQRQPTVPASLGEELETNPFLRFDQEPLCAGRIAEEAFAELRARKDAFRG